MPRKSWNLRLLRLAVIPCAVLVPLVFLSSQSVQANHQPEHVGAAGQTTQTPSLTGSAGQVSTASGGVLTDLTGCDYSFSCILAGVIYIFTVGLGSAVAYVAALVFNIATVLTLNSTAYALTFLSEGWRIVRDIANMFFILILVYIALTVMFRADTAETMKRLAWVIVVALVINFSFFFVRVIIDSGNLLAVQFYNAIEAQPIQATAEQGSVAGIAAAASSYLGQGDLKDLTSSIMNGIGAQQILNTKSFETFQKQASTGFLTELITLTFIYVALGAILFILAAAFFTVGIKFIIRTAVLWLILISAPLAFIAKTLKQSESYYKKWQDALIMHVFYPAVFLFVFYILTLFMDELSRGGTLSVIEQTFDEAGKLQANAPGLAALVPIIATIVVKLGFVIALLYIGLKAADQMGVMGSQLASKIGGKVPFMGGLKSYGRVGGVGFQRTLGWAGSGIGKGLAQTRVGNTRYIGRALRYAPDKLAGAKVGGARSYNDVRADADKRSKERSANMWTINNKDDIKRLGDIEDKQRQGGQLTPQELTDQKRISDRVSRFGKSDMESFKSADLERIVRVLKEGQLKNIKESDKFKAADVEKLEKAWHDQANDAPLKKANKQIELLRDIEASLKTLISHPLQTHTASGATINAANVSAMVTDVSDKIAEVNRNIDETRRAGGDTKSLHQDLHNLRKALTQLDKLDEERKKVPVGAGKMPNGGEFKVT